MGFPLVRGTVEEGVLTYHWHHARFELEKGDTFDPWADDVQTFPVDCRDGQVYVDPNPEPTVPPATRWRNRLADGLQEDISLVQAKAVIGLDSVARSATETSSGERSEPRDDHGDGFGTPLETAVDFGTKYRASWWGRGLTTLSYMAELYPQVGGRDRRRAMFTGVREGADNVAGEAPRFQQYGFQNRDLSKERLKSWFRENCEVRDEDGAERTLLTAIEALPPADVVEHFGTGGDPDDLKRVLGRGLLREDAGFHTLQNVSASFRRFDALDDASERRLALVAGARYLAAHTPTRREHEQTFSIATRLHRGERLHEAK